MIMFFRLIKISIMTMIRLLLERIIDFSISKFKTIVLPTCLFVFKIPLLYLDSNSEKIWAQITVIITKQEGYEKNLQTPSSNTKFGQRMYLHSEHLKYRMILANEFSSIESLLQYTFPIIQKAKYSDIQLQRCKTVYKRFHCGKFLKKGIEIFSILFLI